MASPFKALSPFMPRSIEINYEAFAPSCPPGPSPEAQLVVSENQSDSICGTNVDLGVLAGGSVQTINDVLHSVGTLSLVIGTVIFTGDPGVVILDNPSGNIVPTGQTTGLEFQFTVPNTPGEYGIFIQIPSNDPLGPCTYGYVFSVAGNAGIRVSGPAGDDLCGGSFGPSYTPTGQFSVDDIIHSTGPIPLVVSTVTVVQGAETIVWSADPNGQTINPGNTFQMHGLINLPASGAFDIVVTITSNDANSPCVYHYIGFIIEPITYQWYGASDADAILNHWHLMAGEVNDTTEGNAWLVSHNYNNFKCLISCPSGIAIGTDTTPVEYHQPSQSPPFYFNVLGTNDPLGPTSIYTRVGSIISDY